MFSDSQLKMPESFTTNVFDSRFALTAGPCILREVPKMPNSATVFNINRSLLMSAKFEDTRDFFTVALAAARFGEKLTVPHLLRSSHPID